MQKKTSSVGDNCNTCVMPKKNCYFLSYWFFQAKRDVVAIATYIVCI